MQLFRERSIIAKIEGTEGTDPTPTGSANAILCGNITVTPIGGSLVDRQLSFPTFGAMPKIHVNKHVKVEFDVELAGSGAAGTAPAYGPLLRACAMSETATTSTKVVYAPISSSQESVTIYANESGSLHKLVGARGTVSWMFDKDNYPRMHFSFIGRWTAPAAGSLPTLTTTGFIDPIDMNKVNTPTSTLDSTAIVLESLRIDLGNVIVPRDRPNAAYVAHTDRLCAGQVAFEAPALGTKDYFAKAIGSSMMAGQLIHGITAGNIIQFDWTKSQILQPSYQDVDGIRLLTGGMQFNRTNGDDELTLTVK